MKKYTDEEVMNELEDMGYELYDEDGDEIWSEIAINEGFEWDDEEEYWTWDEDDDEDDEQVKLV